MINKLLKPQELPHGVARIKKGRLINHMPDLYPQAKAEDTPAADYILAKTEIIKKKVYGKLSQFSIDPNRHEDLQRFVGKAHEILLSPDAKRIRCIVPALIADELSLDEDTCLKYGLIVELIHYTSLIHDDVIDYDLQRRGCETLNSLFTNSQAVLIGDFLLCAVIEYSLGFSNSAEVIRLVVDGVKRMVTGIIIEQAVIEENPTLEKYREMVLLKTGALFELSFGLPFVGTDQQEDAIQCGAYFGFLFQVYDDYLDRDKDAPHHNIFHILPQEEVGELWEKNYQDLMVLAGKIGLQRVVTDSIAYLRTAGCFLETETPDGTLFRV